MGNKKLAVALRKYKGKQLLSKFVSDVSQALGRPLETIHLFALEETDVLLEKFISKLDSCNNCATLCFRKNWPVSEVEDLENLLSELKDRIPNTRMFLFRSLSEYCGTIETTSKEILENAFKLISLDQEDLMVLSENETFGVLLCYVTNNYGMGPSEEYELLIWGQDWLIQ